MLNARSLKNWRQWKGRHTCKKGFISSLLNPKSVFDISYSAVLGTCVQKNIMNTGVWIWIFEFSFPEETKWNDITKERSSAYNRKQAVYSIVSIQLMYKVIQTGHNKDPWGTPDSTAL